MLRRWRVVLVVGLALAFVAGGVSPASAKSFRIAAVQVEARLNPDASMRVVEHITYDFDGDFHNGTRPIPPGNYDIVDMTVTEHGEPLPFDGAPYQLAWHFSAANERRTFDIAYTVLGAATVGTDAAVLYWKFVGEAQPGVGEVRIALDVPGDGLDVRAWGHGPLNGNVEIQGPRVLMSVSGLPAGRFLEARVAVPSDQFTVTPAPVALLPAVLAEEGRFAAEANAQREREAAAARRRARIRQQLQRWYWLAPMAGALVYLRLFLRYGKEYKAAVDVGEYVHEPPDDPPAFVPTLFAWGVVQPIALSATLVDLAQRGYLTIEEVREDRTILKDKVDWKLTWKENHDPVRAFEYAVLEQLFARGPETTQSAFATWCRVNRTDADRWWNDVKAKVTRDFKARGYIEGGKGAAYALNVIIALAVMGSGIATLAAGAAIGAAGLVVGGLQLGLTVPLRRRTPAGAQRVAEWEAFRHFLKDFSHLEDAPVGHLILWERYLVYSVALGVTAEVARALAARIPSVGEPGTATFAPWFVGMHGPGALDSIGSFAGFASGFGPEIVAAATPPSSSSSGSGGGGGFSGGGGGGGGGGGIGAS